MQKQNWDAEKYQTEASFVAQLGKSVLQLLAPQAGEKILDLGCGDGELTLQIQNYTSKVIGIDASPEMVTQAKQKGLNVTFLNAEDLKYNQEFDAVFSNAVLHWVSDINCVAQNVYQSLKSEGRFVGEFGGKGNIQSLVKAISQTFEENQHFGTFNNPWYFPSVEEYTEVLHQAGFQINYIELISRPTLLKNGIHSWLEIFANSLTQNLTDETKKQFMTQVSTKLKPLIYSKSEGWVADYVRMRFKATKI